MNISKIFSANFRIKPSQKKIEQTKQTIENLNLLTQDKNSNKDVFIKQTDNKNQTSQNTAKNKVGYIG